MCQANRTGRFFDWLDKSLPYLFVIAGELMITHFDAGFGYLSGLLLILLGGVVSLIRLALSKIGI